MQYSRAFKTLNWRCYIRLHSQFQYKNAKYTIQRLTLSAREAGCKNAQLELAEAAGKAVLRLPRACKGVTIMLEAGTKAPDFTLMDKDGNTIRLSDFLGKKVVLYFYPKDNTPGCTRQACAFAASYEQFKTQNIVVIGISKDSAASHLKFAQKYDLPFILLSDPELQAIQAYDVWQEKKLYGKVSMGVVRTTYIIDEQGIIEKVMPKVKPDTNAADILAYLAGEK